MGHACSRIPVIRRLPHAHHKQNSVYVEASAAFVNVSANKRPTDYAGIISALNNHFIFTSLSEEDKECVAQAMQLHVFEAGTLVFQQDRPSKSYYVLKTGLLQVEVKNRKVSTIRPGEGFGELALLNDKVRPATVKAVEKSEIWGIDRYMFKKVLEEYNTRVYELNREFLEKSIMLKPLTSGQKDTLAVALVNCKFLENEKIINEGDEGKFMYFLKEGIVSVQKGTKEVTRIHPGQFFGETSLLYNKLRTASCVAVDGPAKCVALNRDDLQKALGSRLSEILEENAIMKAIEQSRKLVLLSKDQKENILRDIKVCSYNEGNTVITNNTYRHSYLYIVLRGKLLYSLSGEVFANDGTCIGEEYVTLTGEDQARYQDDIIASEEIKVAIMTKRKFKECIGGTFEMSIRANAAMTVLRKISLFTHVSSKNLKELMQVVEHQKYNDGDIILHEGASVEGLYIVKKGLVNLVKSGKVLRSVARHDYFGERAILLERTCSFDCISCGKTSIRIISKSHFINILNEKMREHLISRIQLQDEDAELGGLHVLRQIGRGLFGRVYLVKSLTQHYALKTVSKRKIRKFGLFEHVKREKRVLQLLDHPFIIRLAKTYKDSERVYYLLEYVHGALLSAILFHDGQLSNNDSLYFIGSVILALQYLHDRDIVYRDLRPDNLMVTEEGTMKLIDFGTAKLIFGKTYTLVGCPYYTAPEVIIGKGYNKLCDLWSVGVTMYELLFGTLPFAEHRTDPYDIYESILESSLEFPSDSYSVSEEAKSLVQQLLCREPAERVKENIEGLKKHEWFYGFDWEKLGRGELPPPYNPDVGQLCEDKHNHMLIRQDSEDSPSGNIEVNDSELLEYIQSVPCDWDEEFNT